MSNRQNARLLRLVDARLAGRRPRRLVQATTRALGWVVRRLPKVPGMRATLDKTAGPTIAWAIQRLPALFDAVAPDAATVPAFDRAVLSWLGVEASVMRYGDRFRLPVVEEKRCVERLYHRDELGRHPGGCPWGLRRPGDGFACRTIMMGSRHVFAGLRNARMKVDIGIPEMLSIESLVVAHLAGTMDASPATVWEALQPQILALFRASAPAEDDFLVDGTLRAETRAVIEELIAALLAGERPAIFCQFRLLTTPPTNA